jgi:hypothetical protein
MSAASSNERRRTRACRRGHVGCFSAKPGLVRRPLRFPNLGQNCRPHCHSGVVHRRYAKDGNNAPLATFGWIAPCVRFRRARGVASESKYHHGAFPDGTPVVRLFHPTDSTYSAGARCNRSTFIASSAGDMSSETTRALFCRLTFMSGSRLEAREYRRGGS